MTTVLVILVAILVVALVALLARRRTAAPPAKPPSPAAGATRILFPFVAAALSRRALDAALRLARAEDATLIPVFLACVPMTLPLESPLPRQAGVGIQLLEAIEQRAAAFGVPVDSRLHRGRSHRHALRRTIADERFERIVVAAARRGESGFGPEDVAWLLAHAPGEIVVLRPDAEDRLLPAPARPDSDHQRLSERRGAELRPPVAARG